MEQSADIENLEERLRLAMLAADVVTLDELIGDHAVFTSQNGTRIDKAADLATHRSGVLRLDRLLQHEPAAVRLFGDVAIVTVTMDLAGTHAGQRFSGAFAYTRVWLLRDGTWRIEAAHASTAA